MPGSAPIANGGRRVVLIDDNADAVESLAELLTISGCEVKTAPDGGSALLLMEQFQPEVAVIDIGLPDMDGYELASRLRAMPGGEKLRIIALTGYSLESDRARSRSAGIDFHIVKPVSFEHLLKYISC